jgi:hypothetical protein
MNFLKWLYVQFYEQGRPEGLASGGGGGGGGVCLVKSTWKYQKFEIYLKNFLKFL